MAKNILGLIEMKANKELILEETFKLAYQKHKKNNFREAEKLYKTILKVHPDNFETIFLWGSLLIQINNFNKAKQLLSKAAIINPKHAETHNNLGIVFKKLGKHKKAINCFFKAIKINSKHPQAYNNSLLYLFLLIP